MNKISAIDTVLSLDVIKVITAYRVAREFINKAFNIIAVPVPEATVFL